MVHLVRLSPRPTEGGAVRDNAFHDYFHSKPDTRTITLGKNRVLNLAKAVSLILCRNETILLHLTSMGFPLLNNGIIGRFSGKIMLWWLNILRGRNRIIIEVNDLYTEQARDLEVSLPVNFARIEFRLFQIPGIIFAFASESMKLFAMRKYGIESRKTLTVINGETLDDRKEPMLMLPALFHDGDTRLRYVYSGTLNRGRSIETMIAAFKNAPATLILLGNDGEWLKETIAPHENVHYLGSFESITARNIVSACDIGLIPYDDSRAYYNIAYPTKLSSYIVAGIPFLSTEILEAKNILAKFPGIGICLPIHRWHDYVVSLNHSGIAEQKIRAQAIRLEFSWTSVLNRFEDTIKDLA